MLKRGKKYAASSVLQVGSGLRYFHQMVNLLPRLVGMALCVWGILRPDRNCAAIRTRGEHGWLSFHLIVNIWSRSAATASLAFSMWITTPRRNISARSCYAISPMTNGRSMASQIIRQLVQSHEA